ncbi:alpha/beta hydrolase [Streptomyces sp. NPDC047000]|uniref:alpha/beta hydrolase n=1 Tax=Streptomyces sp. NPDC047000 TaxID=3155474 RepID=UPI0033DFA970
MTVHTEHPHHTDHHVPAGLLTRGTVVVVPGRGETRATYGRLGRRLAADAYRVRVTDAPDLPATGLDGALTRLGAALADAVEDTVTAGGNGVAAPVVLLGADTGALAVAALLSRTADPAAPGRRRPDAVVLAGLPVHPAGTAAGGLTSWDAELDARTSCPTHRATLTDDTRVRRGALDKPVPDALLTAAYDGDVTVPALLLTGDADPLADHGALRRAAGSWPLTRLAVVRGAHHDVLNDLQHRSVAAEIVTFLETLRSAPEGGRKGGLTPLITVESSAW